MHFLPENRCAPPHLRKTDLENPGATGEQHIFKTFSPYRAKCVMISNFPAQVRTSEKKGHMLEKI